MAASKTRNKMQQLELMEEISRLYRRGHRPASIAKRVGLSYQMVLQYVKRIKAGYEERIAENYKVALGKQLAQYDDVMCEAYEAWEKSKLDAEKTTEEKKLITTYETIHENGKPKRVPNGAKLELVRLIKDVQGQCGGSDYLGIIIRCLEAQAKLERLIDSDIHNTVNLTQINWDMLTERPATFVDPLAKKIEEAKQKQEAEHPTIIDAEVVEADDGVDNPAPNEGEDVPEQPWE